MSRNLGPAALLSLLCASVLGPMACERGGPGGPVPIVWDKEACAECRMLVGEPRFAAQLQTGEGEVLNFDDPGCALRYLGAHRSQAFTVYFHHTRENRWLTQAQAGFIPVPRSPMGYDLGAVPITTGGALSFERASQQVLRAEKRLER